MTKPLIENGTYGTIPNGMNKESIQHENSFYSDSATSLTDLFPKTTSFLTTINIIKAFVGLGVLAAPSGYQMVGFIPATIIIIIFGFVNTYTVHL